MSSPLISIALVTYNHQRFIRDALKGISDQDLDGSMELVIGDDGSDDGTTEIIQEWIGTLPPAMFVRHTVRDRESPDRQAYESGALYNILTTLGECRGDVIAYLEGDDYWICSQKLRMQSEVMGRRSDVTLCFHNARIESHDRSSDVHTTRLAFDSETVEDWDLRGWPRESIATSSIMFRRNLLESLLRPEFRASYVFDAPLFFIAQAEGAMFRLPQVMSCYREHWLGEWSGASAAVKYNGLSKVFSLIAQCVVDLAEDHRDYACELAAYNLIQQVSRMGSSREMREALRSVEAGMGPYSWVAGAAVEKIAEAVDQRCRIESSRSFRFGRTLSRLVGR